MKNFKSIINLVVNKLNKYSPEIFVAVGIVGVIGSTGMACKATIKASKLMEESKNQLDQIHKKMECLPEGYSEEEGKKELAIAYAHTGIKVAKLYGPCIFMGAVSIGSIIASTTILKRRNVALAAAYKTIDAGFKKYRTRVAERFGDEVEKELRYNVRTKKFEENVKDETGKNKKVKKNVDIVDLDEFSEFARFFDPSSREWEPSSEYNLNFLKMTQCHANDVLRARGHLFLNQVYDMLDIPPTKAGQIVGWVYRPEDPDSDGYVDFGIFEGKRESNRDFVNGYEDVILLDFNVDGNILDLI